jgi:hypothetical protein
MFQFAPLHPPHTLERSQFKKSYGHIANVNTITQSAVRTILQTTRKKQQKKTVITN